MRATENAHSRHSGRDDAEQNPWQGDSGPRLPFSINQPTMEGPALKQSPLSFPPCHFPASSGCTDNSLTSETSSSLLKPQSVVQKFVFIVELLFLLLPSPQVSWVLSLSQVLFIFSRSLKSLYVLPGAGLRNNPRFLSA